MKKIGIILIIIGIAITVLSGISLKTEEKVLEIGNVEITHEKDKELSWPRWAGIAVFTGGVVVLLFGVIKKK